MKKVKRWLFTNYKGEKVGLFWSALGLMWLMFLAWGFSI